MDNSPNYFAIIPANVRYCAGLKPNAKLLYGEITALCNKDGFCWAENSYFADLYMVSEETVSRWISDLKRHGFVTVEVENDGRFFRRISLNESVKALDKKVKALDKKIKDPLTKRSTALDEKRKALIMYNNTINNTLNREGNALAFLNENYPSVFESLLIKYKSKIKDFQKASEEFNLKFDTEDLDYTVKIINARAQRFFNRWIENENKFNQSTSSGLIDRQNDVYKQTRF